MKIIAQFTGADKSLGYKKGEEYILIIREVGGISVTRIDGTGKCPYTSLSSFLKNWNNIKKLN